MGLFFCYNIKVLNLRHAIKIADNVRAALRLLLLQARTKTNLLNFFER